MVRSRTSWSDSSVVFTRTEAIYPRVLPILESMSPELTLAKICPKALCRSPPVFGGTRNNGSDSDVFRASPLRRPNSAARPAWECIEQKPSAEAIALHACPSFVFALHLVPFTKSPEARSYRVSKAWVWVGLPLFCKGPSLASVRLRQRVMLAFGALLAEGDVPYVFPTLNQKLRCPINVQ